MTIQRTLYGFEVVLKFGVDYVCNEELQALMEFNQLQYKVKADDCQFVSLILAFNPNRTLQRVTRSTQSLGK
jgi:hypothetical protein